MTEPAPVYPATVEPFLQEFFGAGNRLTLDRVYAASDERTLLVRPWVDRLRQTPPLPTVLPHVRADRVVVWYAIAFSEAQIRSLGDDILAFVGPSWSTYRGYRAPLTPGHPIDAAVLALTNGAAFAFESSGDPGTPKAALEALDRMRRVWSLRPERSRELPRPTGRVLRDFHLALLAQDRETAEAELRYLRDRSRLDALNLLFLRVQMLAEVGRWEELASLPELPAVLQVRRPVPVTESLIRAVYNGRLAAFEAADDPAGAIATLRSDVLPQFGDLFVSHAGMRAPEVAKAFMLAAVSASPVRDDQCREFMAREDLAGADRAWLTRVGSLAPKSSASSERSAVLEPLAAAEAATLDLDFLRAFEFARSAAPSVARTKLLLDCAYNIQSLEAERAALQAFEGLSPSEQTALRSVRTNALYLDQLTATGSAVDRPRPERAAPADWIDWLDRVRDDPDWDNARSVAEQGSVEWTVDSLLARPGGTEALVDGILRSQHVAAVNDALPHILAFFQRDPFWPRDSLANLYRQLLEFVVYVSRGGANVLSRIRDLVEGLLRIGGTEREYLLLVQHCADVWGEHASPAYLDWALDIVDLFVVYPCASDQARTKLLVDVLAPLGQFHRRIEPEQWRFVRLLCSDLRHPEFFELEPREAAEGGASPIQDPLVRLARMSVAIYTLSEEAGKRARDILLARCDGVSVRLNSDHVGTDRLRELARNADIFVMVTAAAKHAATTFIEAHRGKQRPLLRPAGKGSVSILRALCEHVESAAV
jgi:hypothetical protein